MLNPFLSHSILSHYRRSKPSKAMAMALEGLKAFFNVQILLLAIFMFVSGGHSEVTFRYLNQCQDSVWLASNPDIGDTMPEYPRESLTLFQTPDQWTGSIWLRTGCATDSAGDNFTCVTGDCGTGDINCNGGQPKYPVTQMNFAINQAVVTYEVSLMHGYNIPIRIEPDGGTDCRIAECPHDVRNVCPADLVFDDPKGLNVGCLSPCDKFQDPKYCCTGNFSGSACQPNEYSDMFKSTCPVARTYPGDTNPPIYTCTGASYNITFCPI